jgi:hypothetical protein
MRRIYETDIIVIDAYCFIYRKSIKSGTLFWQWIQHQAHNSTEWTDTNLRLKQRDGVEVRLHGYRPNFSAVPIYRIFG